jgi:hypothetical protein
MVLRLIPSRLLASEMLPPAASTARRMASTSIASSDIVACGIGITAAVAAGMLRSAAAAGAETSAWAWHSRSSRKSSDRCSRVIVGSLPAITAAVRSTLNSWRTLPGQGSARTARTTSGASCRWRACTSASVEDAAHQRQQVAAFAQRRQAHGQAVEAVVQVLAEGLVDHLAQVAVGGADDGHVHRHALGAAQRRDLALLQHAQQVRLQRQRHVADLVEEQVPPSACTILPTAPLRRAPVKAPSS